MFPAKEKRKKANGQQCCSDLKDHRQHEAVHGLLIYGHGETDKAAEIKHASDRHTEGPTSLLRGCNET